jgi:predicted nucleotidyltransferase
MTPPDWKSCTENELWRYVAWHLEGEGIRSVLVGGAVVSICTKGAYRSGDLDLITERRALLPEALVRSVSILKNRTILSAKTAMNWSAEFIPHEIKISDSGGINSALQFRT